MTHRVDGAKHELAGQYSERVRAACAGSNQELASATGVDECTSKKALIRSGFGTQRPNLISNPNLPESKQTTAQFFNIAAFTVVPQFTIGTSSRNPVRGPNYRNADFALIKRVYLSETRNLELRAEAFNVTNTPPLGAANAVLASPGFGSITSAGCPRVIQLGVKFNF